MFVFYLVDGAPTWAPSHSGWAAVSGFQNYVVSMSLLGSRTLYRLWYDTEPKDSDEENQHTPEQPFEPPPPPLLCVIEGRQSPSHSQTNSSPRNELEDTSKTTKFLLDLRSFRLGRAALSLAFDQNMAPSHRRLVCLRDPQCRKLLSVALWIPVLWLFHLGAFEIYPSFSYFQVAPQPDPKPDSESSSESHPPSPGPFLAYPPRPRRGTLSSPPRLLSPAPTLPSLPLPSSRHTDATLPCSTQYKDVLRRGRRQDYHGMEGAV